MAHQETLRRRHAPTYRQTRDAGLPSLPNRPRTPHIPHSKAIVAGVILALAGTAAGGVFRKVSDPMPNPDGVAAAAMTKDEIQVVYDGRQLINLTKSPDGEIQERPTSVAQILKAESFNVEDQVTFVENIAIPEGGRTVAVTLSPESLVNAYFVPVLGSVSELYPNKDQYADIQVNRSIAEINTQGVTNTNEHILLDSGAQGDLYLRLSFFDGTPVEGPNGKPIYTKPSQVNLIIPEQVPAPVTG